MTVNNTAYILPHSMDLTDLFSGLPTGYLVQPGSVVETTIAYLDTFDYRLYHKGLLCRQHNRKEYVVSNFTGDDQIQADGPPLKKLFAADFPVGPLAEKIGEAAGIRALFAIFTILKRTQIFHILNRDQKIVVSGELSSNYLPGSNENPVPVDSFLRFHGIRGYDGILTRINALVQRQGLLLTYTEDETFRRALTLNGNEPTLESFQISIILDPAESVVQAARKIFLHLLKEMEQNINGVLHDIDSEFLHDFRVALRRTRSLLGSIKKMVPAADAVHFLQKWRDIGEMTGPVRDLDVYLLDKETYHSMVPEVLQDGLALFFQGVAQQRIREQKKLRTALQSPVFHNFLEEWRHFIENALSSTSVASGHEPCKDVAGKAIRKRWRAIVKNGGLIGPQSPDSDLHSLRIEAKKLRYLLEFYRNLFPLEQLDIIVKSLKKLQDNLGRFNDLSVQQDMLGRHQNDLTGWEQIKAIKVASALGGLITHLHEEQGLIRQKFEQTFAQFASPENSALFHSLFDKESMSSAESSSLQSS